MRISGSREERRGRSGQPDDYRVMTWDVEVSLLVAFLILMTLTLWGISVMLLVQRGHEALADWVRQWVSQPYGPSCPPAGLVVREWWR